MANGLNNLPSAIPWYKSKVIVGAALSILTKVLVATGVVSDIAPADVEQLANGFVLVAGAIGDMIAIGARVTQKAAPAITAAKTVP